jgi:hypothetical protein
MRYDRRQYRGYTIELRHGDQMIYRPTGELVLMLTSPEMDADACVDADMRKVEAELAHIRASRPDYDAIVRDMKEKRKARIAELVTILGYGKEKFT